MVEIREDREKHFSNVIQTKLLILMGNLYENKYQMHREHYSLEKVDISLDGFY